VYIKTRGLDATDTEPDRVRARVQDGSGVLTEPYAMAGDYRDTADTHQRTARALARSILGDVAFDIVQTGESATGYTFKVTPH
jgi:hypothetical protein